MQGAREKVLIVRLLLKPGTVESEQGERPWKDSDPLEQSIMGIAVGALARGQALHYTTSVVRQPADLSVSM